MEAPQAPQLVLARRWEVILLALLCVVTAACCLHVVWRPEQGPLKMEVRWTFNGNLMELLYILHVLSLPAGV